MFRLINILTFGNFSITRSERKKDRRGMIEMDRFVSTLQGVENEEIERKSADSAATMRQPVTNDR